MLDQSRSDKSRLSLARAWRSSTFDELIGQELAVRVLKNGLYRGLTFPVYLFAGQRGCGKTSAARLFAAALNCEKLEEFRANPRAIVLPCKACASCVAQRSGSHPDIIEIDAASHTGVDHVRDIIDAASYLPVLGRVRVYIIDEAHMLSKAAFNAFLKILEEPPRSVTFILATTDPHKIVDTVRSRCFQLFFDPVTSTVLVNHLAHVCDAEKIIYEREALELIVQHAEGSVRDAINILERVRGAEHDGAVTVAMARVTLGAVPFDELCQLLTYVAQADNGAISGWFSQHALAQRAALMFFVQLLQTTRALIWKKYGQISPEWEMHAAQLEEIAALFATEKLLALFEKLYANEPLMHKTHGAAGLCEMLLLARSPGHEMPAEKLVQKPVENSVEKKKQPHSDRWQQFLENINELRDPLISSIFAQALIEQAEENRLSVIFSQELSFFSDMLESTKSAWMAILQQIYGEQVVLDVQFRSHITAKKPEIILAPKNSVQKSANPAHPPVHPIVQPAPISVRAVRVDVSNAQEWPQANLLLRHFPGTIVELREGEDTGAL